MTAVGFTLQPNEEFIALCSRAAVELADYWEVAPETLWRPRADGALVANGFHAHYAAMQARYARPVVAHGVGLSLGSASPDRARRAKWLERIREDHAKFRFEWYSDHLGATALDGRELILPVPLLMGAEAARAVRATLNELKDVVPDVGFENSVFYFHLGEPLDEPAFLRECLEGPRTHLVLDLHNVFTTALNYGFDPWEYIERAPLERVIEIHVSGGSDSDAAWLPSRATLRLDSHDTAVPEDVWRLLERTAPLCSSLRGVTLERMEGTIGESDVAVLEAELRRVRSIVGGARG